MSSEPTQLAAARRFAALGLSVIPLDSPKDPIANDRRQAGKVPAVKWAPFQIARATDDNLVNWFANGHARNIGIVTGAISDLVMVDTDTADAEAWAAANLPDTPIKTVTAKGLHRGYRHPGRTVPNKARIRDGVDVRGDGGYVVAPGSQHATGHIYHELDPWPDSLVQVPRFDLAWLGIGAERREWTTPASNRPASAPIDRDRLRARVRAYLENTPGAIEGQGGDAHTFQVCCRVVRGFQLDAADAHALLSEWNTAKCVPPWSDRELDAKIENALRHGSEPMGGRATDRPFVPPSRTDEDFSLSDTGNAEAFAAWYGDFVRFDHRRARYLVWSGHRFLPDADAAVERMVKETIRRREELALALPDPGRKAALKWALTSESRQRREAMLKNARCEQPIADPGTQWDRDPWLLGVPNGVVDLRNGGLRAGHPDDRITMSTTTPFDPSAGCPLWESVVADIFDGDPVLVAYAHRAIGYSLTGITTEQCLFLLDGVGSNGKTTILNTIRALIGDYGYQMPFATVLSSRNDVATNDLAALDGRRFVLASEVNDGVRFDEARLKALTGCDPISARFLYSEFFEFIPVAKFWLSVNHKPLVRDDSHAFWRRMRLLPFRRTFPVNPTLADDLRAEAPGILAWAVRGCLQWQAEGLGTPDVVLGATAAYQRDSDALGEFVAESCDLDPDAECPAAVLYRGYITWAERQGLTERERLNRTMFGRKAAERFTKEHARSGTIYRGLRLRSV